MRNLFMFCAVVVCSSIGAATAHGDVTMRMKVTSDVGSEKPDVSAGVTFISPGRMAQRVDGTPEDPGTDVIFRSDRELMWIVDHGDKTYQQVDSAAMAKVATQIEQAKAQMQAEMAKLPPDQRALIEERMKGVMPGAPAAPAPKIEYRKTGETKTISGFECTKYERVEDGKIEEVLWIAPHKATGFTAEDEDVFRKMGEFMEKLFAAMGPATSERLGDEFEAVAKLGGWPIVTQSLDEDGKVLHEALVESIAHDKLSESVFDVPAGYTQKSATLGQE